MPDHYELLRVAEIERLGVWWRNAGAPQNPEEFAERVWKGILLQFIAVGLDDDQALAWLQCYNADPVNQSAAISLARLDSRRPSLRVWSAVALFIEHCFATYGFRKLYAEVAGPNLQNFESMIGPLLVEEGRLAGHLAAGPGEYCDLHILSLWNFNWQASPMREQLLERA